MFTQNNASNIARRNSPDALPGLVTLQNIERASTGRGKNDAAVRDEEKGGSSSSTACCSSRPKKKVRLVYVLAAQENSLRAYTAEMARKRKWEHRGKKEERGLIASSLSMHCAKRGKAFCCRKPLPMPEIYIPVFQDTDHSTHTYTGEREAGQ